MFIQVGSLVINIELITVVNVKNNNTLKIFFSDEHYREIAFTSKENLQNFMNFLNIQTVINQ